MAPLVLLNAVGLTGRLLRYAPRLGALAKEGWCSSLREVTPAVTCTAQATILTGATPEQHGVVANGWLYRETGEVRFWQQSNRLIQADTVYGALRRMAAEAGRPFRVAKLFWWFNQGAPVDVSVTPKPYYGIDGGKAFGITGTPAGLTEQLERDLGRFPFHTFWGPKAGLPCTRWIGRCAAQVLRPKDGPPPDFTMVYLPHLDYETQVYGPENCDFKQLVGELDEACAPVLDAARAAGARVWVVSEYGHCSVRQPVLPNLALRRAYLLNVRPGPFGEHLDTFTSRAFAVCDHQVAHVYVREAADRDRVRDLIVGLPGVARVLAGDERGQVGLNHPRAGELVALSRPDAWFAYPFWYDDAEAPDYARTVAIHHKPGYDPCELFLDDRTRFGKMKPYLRLAQKTLGFRTRFDVIPLDPTLVRGSHGLPAAAPEDRPVLIGTGPAPPQDLEMTGVAELLYRAFVEA